MIILLFINDYRMMMHHCIKSRFHHRSLCGESLMWRIYGIYRGYQMSVYLILNLLNELNKSILFFHFSCTRLLYNANLEHNIPCTVPALMFNALLALCLYSSIDVTSRWYYTCTIVFIKWLIFITLLHREQVTHLIASFVKCIWNKDNLTI